MSERNTTRSPSAPRTRKYPSRYIPDDLAETSRLDAALAWTTAGFYIGPARAGTKNPGSILGGNWNEQSSRSRRQIRAWWKAHPDAEIFVHVGRSGCLAFDFDQDDFSALPELYQSELRKAMFQNTRPGTDRGHYLFRMKQGEEFGNNAPKDFAPFGEVRGKNGVIMVQPSRHAAGGEYVWPTPGPVPLRPRALAERLKTAEDYAPALPDAELEAFLDKHTGNDRPDALNGVLEALRRDLDDGRRSSRHECFTSALAWAFEESAAGCYPARTAYLALAEKHGEAYSVPGRTPGRTEFRDEARWAAGQAEQCDPAKTLAKMNRSVDDSEFWSARPFLRDLHQFARARRVSPWAMLGATMVRAVAAVPPEIVLPPGVGSEASLNLFVALVGASGGGKGAAEQAANDFLETDYYVETEAVGSGEGISKLYAHKSRGEQVNDRNAIIFSVPEVDNLTALGSRQGATLMPQLRQAWVGERLGFAYADPAKAIRLERHRYRLTLILGVQPDRAGPLMEDADGGTPQRFLWFPATDPGAPDNPPEPPPSVLLPGWPEDDITARGRAISKLNVRANPKKLVRIGVAEVAREFADFSRLARLRGAEEDPLDGHAPLARLKVAAALMVLDGRFDKITDEDWELSEVVCAVSKQTRDGVQRSLGDRARLENVQRGRAEGRRAVAASEVTEDAVIKRVGENIRKHLARESPQTRRALSKRIALRDREHFDEAANRLVAAGVVRESAGSYEIA